jgi:hypothetical protein
MSDDQSVTAPPENQTEEQFADAVYDLYVLSASLFVAVQSMPSAALHLDTVEDVQLALVMLDRSNTVEQAVDDVVAIHEGQWSSDLPFRWFALLARAQA